METSPMYQPIFIHSLAMMKPHAIVIPYPTQGHIAPLLKLAKILHSRGFYITFVHTEFNYNRLVRTQGPDSVKGFDNFQYKTIPDGLPPLTDIDATQDVLALCQSLHENGAIPFLQLVKDLNDKSADCPRVSCIIADGVMSSVTLDAAEEVGIPYFLFFTMSACGFMGYLHFAQLVARGYVPLKDESWLTNGYLEKQIDWIPGMKGIRLKDLPSFVRTTDPEDILLNYNIIHYKNAARAKGLILNTFDELEKEVLDAIIEKLGHVNTIGPLHLLEKHLLEKSGKLNSIEPSLWKQDKNCLEWLDQQETNSVIYVNYGSLTIMSAQQLSEFAWGLADSKKHFLWIVRPDLVRGESAMLPEEFFEEIKDRGHMAEWCSQEHVLAHPSVGVFLTHCGWNSTIESISSGVPLICWPFFAEQQTNCKYACSDWNIGVEIDSNIATRRKVADSVKVMMEGEKGKEMKRKALEWKDKARVASEPGGSSYENLEKLLTFLHQPHNNALPH